MSHEPSPTPTPSPLRTPPDTERAPIALIEIESRNKSGGESLSDKSPVSESQIGSDKSPDRISKLSRTVQLRVAELLLFDSSPLPPHPTSLRSFPCYARALLLSLSQFR